MKRFLLLSALFAITQICGCGTCSLFAKPVDLPDSTAAVKKTGPKTLQVKITGMTCAGCASGLHKVLSKQAGILASEVNYPGDVAVIKYDEAEISEARILAVIAKTGYKAQVLPAAKTTSLKAAGSCCAKKVVL